MAVLRTVQGNIDIWLLDGTLEPVHVRCGPGPVPYPQFKVATDWSANGRFVL